MKKSSLILFLFIMFCTSCTKYTPKPRGYFRIEPGPFRYCPVSEKSLPFDFNVSSRTKVTFSFSSDTSKWLTISYPELNAAIYCSYVNLSGNLFKEVSNESRFLVEQQAVVKDGIHEKYYANPQEKVYGSLFLLDGASASPVQFMLTDSTKHFFRGALYYNCEMNPDSLSPVTELLRNDIIEIIQSFSWK